MYINFSKKEKDLVKNYGKIVALIDSLMFKITHALSLQQGIHLIKHTEAFEVLIHF